MMEPKYEMLKPNSTNAHFIFFQFELDSLMRIVASYETLPSGWSGDTECSANDDILVNAS